MALSANTPSVLKILSGPHQGAEVLLPLGETTIGSSLDCDVILSDTMLAAVHFQLKVMQSGVEVLAQAPDVFCQGKRVPVGQSAKLGNFEFISVGTTQMVVGPSEGEWPYLTATDAPALFTDIVESANSEELEDAQAVAETDTHDDNGSQFTGFGDRMTQELSEERNQFTWFSKLEQGKCWSIGAGVFVLGCLIVWILFGSSWLFSENAVASADLAAVHRRVQACIDKLNIPAGLTCEAVGNNIVVYGYVKSEDQKAQLTKALGNLGPNVLVKIYSEDGLAREGQELMQQCGLKVAIKANGPGKLQVTGYAADVAVWERARGILLSDLAGVKAIEDQVMTGQQIQAQASKILGPLNLASRVLITPQPQQVAAMGIISESLAQPWQQAREELMHFLNDIVALNDQVRISDSTTATQNYFDNQLEIISVESPRWISLQNGQKYFVGATLPSGYMIEDIDDSGITLKRGTEQVKLNLRSL